ncbi:MAG: adenylate/guanylate cyclase domain-containing protein [Acidobacteriota bacterium]
MKSSLDLSAQPGRDLLNRLLSERNQNPDRIEEIDRRLKEAFERRVAILALDMCGFSRLTSHYGIIHYLAMIQQMEAAARPAVRQNGGVVIKQEADNLWAIFDTPTKALEGALDILRAFDAINSVVPSERDIFGTIGIGYGDTLVVGSEDLFGSEMNLASKLGEDLGGKNEILITAAAYGLLSTERYLCEPARFSISGVIIDCYRFKEKRYPRKRNR